LLADTAILFNDSQSTVFARSPGINHNVYERITHEQSNVDPGRFVGLESEPVIAFNGLEPDTIVNDNVEENLGSSRRKGKKIGEVRHEMPDETRRKPSVSKGGRTVVRMLLV
jgi:hypothetical protein